MKRVLFIIFALFFNTVAPSVSSAHPILTQSVAVPPGGILQNPGLIQLNTQTGKMWYCNNFEKRCFAFKGLPDGNPSGLIGVFKLTEVHIGSFRGGSTGHVVYRFSSWDGSAYVCSIGFRNCQPLDDWEERKPQQINVYQAAANEGRIALPSGLTKLNTHTGEMWYCNNFEKRCFAFKGLPKGRLFQLTKVNKGFSPSSPTEVVYRYSGETGSAYVCGLQLRQCQPVPSVPIVTTGPMDPPSPPKGLDIEPLAAPSLAEEKS